MGPKSSKANEKLSRAHILPKKDNKNARSEPAGQINKLWEKPSAEVSAELKKQREALAIKNTYQDALNFFAVVEGAATAREKMLEKEIRSLKNKKNRTDSAQKLKELNKVLAFVTKVKKLTHKKTADTQNKKQIISLNDAKEIQLEKNNLKKQLNGSDTVLLRMIQSAQSHAGQGNQLKKRFTRQELEKMAALKARISSTLKRDTKQSPASVVQADPKKPINKQSATNHPETSINLNKILEQYKEFFPTEQKNKTTTQQIQKTQSPLPSLKKTMADKQKLSLTNPKYQQMTNPAKDSEENESFAIDFGRLEELNHQGDSTSKKSLEKWSKLFEHEKQNQKAVNDAWQKDEQHAEWMKKVELLLSNLKIAQDSLEVTMKQANSVVKNVAIAEGTLKKQARAFLKNLETAQETVVELRLSIIATQKEKTDVTQFTASAFDLLQDTIPQLEKIQKSLTQKQSTQYRQQVIDSIDVNCVNRALTVINNCKKILMLKPPVSIEALIEHQKAILANLISSDDMSSAKKQSRR